MDRGRQPLFSTLCEWTGRGKRFLPPLQGGGGNHFLPPPANGQGVATIFVDVVARLYRGRRSRVCVGTLLGHLPTPTHRSPHGRPLGGTVAGGGGSAPRHPHPRRCKSYEPPCEKIFSPLIIFTFRRGRGRCMCPRVRILIFRRVSFFSFLGLPWAE